MKLLTRCRRALALYDGVYRLKYFFHFWLGKEPTIENFGDCMLVETSISERDIRDVRGDIKTLISNLLEEVKGGNTYRNIGIKLSPPFTQLA